jgi:hypothetical protein
MQDRPTAVELLKAAQEFCEHDLLPNLTGRVRFHTRVLQNVLGILAREWEGEEDAVRAEWERLRDLLDSTGDEPTSFHHLVARVRDLNRELSSRIRAGAMDGRWDQTVDAVYETVVTKLEIANPRYSASSET